MVTSIVISFLSCFLWVLIKTQSDYSYFLYLDGADIFFAVRFGFDYYVTPC